MRKYSEITTQVEMDMLLERVAGFHDSMAKELHLCNRGWVGPDRSMMMSHRFDARLLIHTQWDPVAIELLFIGIERLTTGDPGVCFGASGVVELRTAPVESRCVSITFDHALSITAEKLYTIERPEWTGPRSRFGTEVPHPDCVTGIRVDDRWRQCSACADAFDVPTDITYFLCPGCGAMTELETEDAHQADSADGPNGAPMKIEQSQDTNFKYWEYIDLVKTKADFDRFMSLLRQDWEEKHMLVRKPDGAYTQIKEPGWENPYLPDFFEALQAWVNDSLTLPADFPYHELAKIINAGVMYE